MPINTLRNPVSRLDLTRAMYQSPRAALLRKLVGVGFLMLFVAGGCGKTDSAGSVGADAKGPRAVHAGSGPIRAVCTTGMVADVVRQIGGDRVAVDQIMGEGIDPHLFKATPDVIRRLSEADVVFYSGLHLEGRMVEIFERMADRKPTVAVTSTIPVERLLDVGGGSHDPHVWFDVALWSRTTEAVQNFLVEFDPAHRAEYETRAADYRKQLAALDDEVRNKLQTIPKATRVLVTAHDAFHYFGRAYDVEVRAIQGISTDTEAGVKEINQLVSFIVANKIKAVFVEASVSERNIAALAEGCRAQGHDVRIGGQLYSDSMGAAGTEAGTYVGMVRHNVQLIVDALK
jgi:manganese/zinc/iron transport system substrate-binding protein